MKILILVLSTLLLANQALCSLQVVDPPMLRNEFNNQPIQYSLANFGHIPYGRTIIGHVVQADPLEACSPLKSNFSSQVGYNPIVFVKRGNCSFVTKVKYAQLVGAKAVIIVDNVRERSESITMADDGHAYEIRIPSVFIEEDDGLKIQRYLNNPDKEQNQVVLTLKFDMNKQDHVNYTFWITTSNRQSFKLVKDFANYNKQLGNLVSFTPHYAIWTCWYCRITNYVKAPENCVSGGRYCAPDPDGYGPATGRDIILEDLRQICIHKLNNQSWWDYMVKFDEECINMAFLDQCSKNIQKSLGIDSQKVEQCVQDSYVKTGSSVNILTDDNKLLEQERVLFLQHGIIFWPSVTINNAQYRGSLESADVLEAICAVYSNTPDICKSLQEEASPSPPAKQGVNVTVIVIVVILLLVVFSLFMLFVYKRMVQRELKKEMSSQVNTMVSQYIAFYETRDRKTRDNEL